MTDHHVAIVGAGFSGLGLAIRLRRRGIDDVVVFERGDDVGGTWRDNTCPGAACDVPSVLYSCSFAPNPDWTRSFSPQADIQAYLRRCAERFGVLPHVRLGQEVLATTWDEEAQRWVVDTTGGRCTAWVVVSARGPLSEPRLPGVPGFSTFGGTLFHSARWDHGHDLAGERVAVIGTGASAVQFVPEVQLFARGHAPEVVARAILRAVEADRPVALAGPEAHAGWLLHRVLPTRAVDALARLGPW